MSTGGALYLWTAPVLLTEEGWFYSLIYTIWWNFHLFI